ncbi:MAG: IS3 family transposase [Chitinophagales bacterium]|nr:IS3 family transposase [Chitinophagales bacterium]
MTTIRKTYTRDFKIKAVELSKQRGNAAAVAKELGIREQMLYKWKVLYEQGKLMPEKVSEKSKEELEIARLRKALKEAELERDIFKKGRRHLHQERTVRYGFIKNHQYQFPVVTMCKVLQVSKSGYYGWLHHQPSKRTIFNQMLLKEIKRIHALSRQRYGSPRIAKVLQMQGIKASEKLVAKLMRENEIRRIIRKKYKTTTDSKHDYPVAENKLNRAFLVKDRNEVWVSDLTYISTGEGWLYLTTVIDLFDRKIVGWALSSTMHTKNTTVPAFRMAVQNSHLKNSKLLIFHSDRGIQYACDEFTNELGKHKNITQSMSRKGNCWDNAVAESFFKTLKTELIYHHRYKTIAEAELEVFEYIEIFYNKNRRHQHLKNLTLNEFHQSFINQTKNAA